MQCGGGRLCRPSPGFGVRRGLAAGRWQLPPRPNVRKPGHINASLTASASRRRQGTAAAAVRPTARPAVNAQLLSEGTAEISARCRLGCKAHGNVARMGGTAGCNRARWRGPKTINMLLRGMAGLWGAGSAAMVGPAAGPRAQQGLPLALHLPPACCCIIAAIWLSASLDSSPKRRPTRAECFMNLWQHACTHCGKTDGGRRQGARQGEQALG